MLNETLSWLTSSDGGALIIVLWFVSWALEDVDGWHNLSSKTRQAIILFISVVLAVGAAVLQNSPELVTAIEPYFRPAAYVMLAWVATQTAHKANKALGAAGTPAGG